MQSAEIIYHSGGRHHITGRIEHQYPNGLTILTEKGLTLYANTHNVIRIIDDNATTDTRQSQLWI